MKTELCYLFKKSLVSWKGRKHKHQCELTTSFICINTIRDQAASMNIYSFPYEADILAAAKDKTKKTNKIITVTERMEEGPGDGPRPASLREDDTVLRCEGEGTGQVKSGRKAG